MARYTAEGVVQLSPREFAMLREPRPACLGQVWVECGPRYRLRQIVKSGGGLVMVINSYPAEVVRGPE